MCNAILDTRQEKSAMSWSKLAEDLAGLAHKMVACKQEIVARLLLYADPSLPAESFWPSPIPSLNRMPVCFTSCTSSTIWAWYLCMNQEDPLLLVTELKAHRSLLAFGAGRQKMAEAWMVSRMKTVRPMMR